MERFRSFRNRLQYSSQYNTRMLENVIEWFSYIYTELNNTVSRFFFFQYSWFLWGMSFWIVSCHVLTFNDCNFPDLYFPGIEESLVLLTDHSKYLIFSSTRILFGFITSHHILHGSLHNFVEMFWKKWRMIWKRGQTVCYNQSGKTSRK